MNDYVRAASHVDYFMGSVLVAQHGRVLLSKGYGMANLKLGIPNTPDGIPDRLNNQRIYGDGDSRAPGARQTERSRSGLEVRGSISACSEIYSYCQARGRSTDHASDRSRRGAYLPAVQEQVFLEGGNPFSPPIGPEFYRVRLAAEKEIATLHDIRRAVANIYASAIGAPPGAGRAEPGICISDMAVELLFEYVLRQAGLGVSMLPELRDEWSLPIDYLRSGAPTGGRLPGRSREG
jgi:hypothetical protein